MLCALCSGMNSYRNTENRIAQDVNQALEQVLVKMPNQVITTDTIRCYRSYLTIAELKDTAGIALRTVRRNGRLETRLVAEANCSFASIFMMSDQRGSASLFMVGVLWLLGSWWYTRRNKPSLVVPGLSYGGLVYHDDHFMTLSGDQIHLTPMQHALLEMFMTSDTHRRCGIYRLVQRLSGDAWWWRKGLIHCGDTCRSLSCERAQGVHAHQAIWSRV